MNQGKLDVIKKGTGRMNINILGISERKWIGMGELNSDDHCIYYCGQEFLTRNGVKKALRVKKRIWNAVLGYNLKNDRNDLSSFPRQTIQYHSNSILCPNNWWRTWSWPVLWRPTTPSKTNTKKKRCPFHHRGLECKSTKSRDTQSNRQVWTWSKKWSRAKADSFLKRTQWSYQTLSNNPRHNSAHGDHQMINT